MKCILAFSSQTSPFFTAINKYPCHINFQYLYLHKIRLRQKREADHVCYENEKKKSFYGTQTNIFNAQTYIDNNIARNYTIGGQ